jgi:integrase
VFKLAGIKGHPHMFRDTFSVGLLNQGTSMRTVQLLLGHSSIQTTEKHYAPFDRGTQVILDAAVSKLDFGLGLAKKRVKNRVRDPKRNVISLSA